jgi:hypothetical protein
MNLKEELFRVVSALGDAEVDYALCGGMAVIIHGYPRATRDIDILIREKDLDRAQQSLRHIGYSLASGMIPFDVGKPTERRVLRITKVEDDDFLTLDLILISPFLRDVWDSREKHLVENREIRVVSRAGLAKMKRAAGRPQDLADLAGLEMENDE